MPSYRRADIEGGTYFFTVVTFQRQPVLTDMRCRAALRGAIESIRIRMPFTILAWVLLPDHLHAIWRLPEGDAGFSLRWSHIKRQVSRECEAWLPQQIAGHSRRKRRESALWQRRFWEHLIRDEEDLSRHADYIHYNPVKHGYVTRPVDWPYSTIHRYVSAGIYPRDWAVDSGGTEGEYGE